MDIELNALLRSSPHLAPVILIFPDRNTETLHLSVVKIDPGNNSGSKEAFQPIDWANKYKFTLNPHSVHWTIFFAQPSDSFASKASSWTIAAILRESLQCYICFKKFPDNRFKNQTVQVITWQVVILLSSLTFTSTFMSWRYLDWHLFKNLKKLFIFCYRYGN